MIARTRFRTIIEKAMYIAGKLKLPG